MNEPGMQEVSWTGAGDGTNLRTFVSIVQERLLNERAVDAIPAVCEALAQRLPGGVVRRLLAQLPEEVRPLLGRIAKDERAPGMKLDKTELYRAVARRLDIEPTEARRILHAVFAGLHSQITESTSERIVAELPDELAGTWLAARGGVDVPR